MTKQDPPTKKVIPIIAQPADEVMVSLYAARKDIYPRSVSGFFTRWRWAMVILTQLVFYGLPWVEWGQRQAILFDLGDRRFYIFGLVLYPQDFIYLTGLLVISALALFLFTAVAGRLWCGYACPQTVYTEMFLWIEKQMEGDRSARMRRDAQPMSMDKFWRKGGKHILWLLLAMWTGFTFVGYFTPIKELGLAFIQLNMGSWEIFWSIFYGFATYGNAGFMREQVCLHMCPYARFQSAMFDRDTLIVTYDQARGEPRGPRTKKVDYKAKNLGDCIDCTLCVQVCPVGIDIRNGLQYECIGCGLCVDACNSIMDKMSYPRGLIRFSTQNALTKGWSQAEIIKRVRRPRVLIYTAILVGLCIAMLVSMLSRSPLKVDIERDRSALSRIVAGGKLENVYRLQIMNATEQPQSYQIAVSGLQGLELEMTEPEVKIDASQSRWVAVRLQIPYGSAEPGSHPVQFEIKAVESGAKVSEKSLFLVPR